MHWSRVKTILIFLFLALNIMMMTYILSAGHDPGSINKSEIRDIVNIYASNNVYIDDKLIPKKTEYLGIVEVRNLWTDKEKIAEIFLGTGYNILNGKKYTAGNKSLEFFDDIFVYEDKEILQNDKSRADGFLKNFHIYTNEECFSGDSVRQEINDKPVFETGITVFAGDNGISHLSGFWIMSDDSSLLKKKPVRLKPISSILIDFLSTNSYNAGGDKIISIETGYSTGAAENDTTHKLVSVVPAYKITTESGGYAVFDAAVGELLYEGGKE